MTTTDLFEMYRRDRTNCGCIDVWLLNRERWKHPYMQLTLDVSLRSIFQQEACWMLPAALWCRIAVHRQGQDDGGIAWISWQLNSRILMVISTGAALRFVANMRGLVEWFSSQRCCQYVYRIVRRTIILHALTTEEERQPSPGAIKTQRKVTSNVQRFYIGPMN